MEKSWIAGAMVLGLTAVWGGTAACGERTQNEPRVSCSVSDDRDGDREVLEIKNRIFIPGVEQTYVRKTFRVQGATGPVTFAVWYDDEDALFHITLADEPNQIVAESVTKRPSDGLYVFLSTSEFGVYAECRFERQPARRKE